MIGRLRGNLRDWSRTERILGAILLLWAALGLVHTTFALAGDYGWAPKRTAASRMTLGLPDNERAPLVAWTRQALREVKDSTRLVVVLPAHADSTDVIYTRYQLAHLEYPRRVAVVRDVAGVELPARVPPATVFVFVPVDEQPPYERRDAGEVLPSQTLP